jgi:hypothetical protein
MAKTIIDEYLIKLGFTTDTVGYNKFAAALRDAASMVDNESTSIASKFLKWQIAITGGFAAAGAAALGLVDKVAMQDQSFRMLALRMFTTTNVARELKISMDALGEPLENIAWDPELSRRFSKLVSDQKTMTEGLGPGFEKQMISIRDMRFEITRFSVELQYLSMMLVRDFAKIFGIDPSSLLEKFRNLNDWIIKNLPGISDWIESRLSPAIRDMKMVLGDTWELLKLFAVTFQNLVGLLSGDKSIEGTTASFDKMATAIRNVLGWLADFVNGMVKAEETLLHVLNAAILAKEGKRDAAKAELAEARKAMSIESMALTGTAIGFAVGGPAGAALGGIGGAIIGYGAEKGNQVIADRRSMSQSAMGYANYASQKLGIPAKLIYEQWALETGGFTSPLTYQNNLGGIGGKGKYEKFGDLKEFADRYVEIISGRRYAGLSKPTTENEMANFLASGHYFTHADEKSPPDARDIQNYAAGMQRFAPKVDVTVIVQGTSATAKEIEEATRRGVQEAANKQTQRNIAEFQEPGWSYN